MSKDFNYEHIKSYLIGAIDDYGDDIPQDDGVKGWDKLDALTREQCFELVKSFASSFFDIRTDTEDDEYFTLHCVREREKVIAHDTL